MCDACVNAMRHSMEALTDEQRKAVDAYVAHEFETMREEMGEDQKNLEEQMDEASATALQVRELLSVRPLDVDTSIAELAQHIKNYHRALELIDEIGTKLERTV